MSDTLLLADDSVTMQRVVELTFAEQGLKVVSVADGQQAIDYIARQQPALALVSASLPKVNGFDVARFVRDHVENRVPVLLLAGAFDNLDEAQVRASGASGVLVKPFEPSVVIKRVKELLGMKSEPARPMPVRPPASASGRMFTSSDGPTRRPPTPPPQEPTAAAAPAPDGSWERVRDEGGLGEAAASVEAQGRSGDYLDHLDAAFDSLDAQLAGRAAPAGRATNPPPAPSIPAAIDPGRRPASPHIVDDDRAAGDDEASRVAATPVFEVDENWFDKKPAAADSLGDLTEFVVTRASDYTPSPPSAAPDQDQSWLPPAVREPSADAPPAAATMLDAAPERHPKDTPDAAAAAVTSPMPTAVGPSAASADAFAMLWAQEQGEPVPATPPPAALELSEQAVDAITSQLTDRVAARMGAPLAERLTRDLAAELTHGVADRITGTVADRLTSDLPGPLTAGISERISSGLADRLGERLSHDLTRHAANDLAPQLLDQLGSRLENDLAPRLTNELAPRLADDLSARLANDLASRLSNDLAPRIAGDLSAPLLNELVARLGPPLLERVTASLGDRLIAALGDRLSDGLAERVGTLVAERALQGVLGDSLRETVREVAERLVREEIDRIKAAAGR